MAGPHHRHARHRTHSIVPADIGLAASTGATALAPLYAGPTPSKRGVKLDIKAPSRGTVGFTPIWPLYKVEHAFARLGRWRRLSRCYEGTPESARAWMEVAALAYLFARLRAEPA
jgi:transposase